VVEALFRNYFSEEKFLNDPKVLEAAALEAGIDPEVAARFVGEEAMMA